MKMTLRDIAKEARVSAATVSRAINTPEKVRPVTLKRIADAARKAGYDIDVSSAASGLPRNKTIACITKEIKMPFMVSALSALSKIASDNGFYASIHVTFNEENEKALYDMYSNSNCAGIVLSGDSYIRHINAKVPVCVLDETSRISGNFFNVSSDNNKAIRLLLDHLTKLGHTKIGFISGDPMTSSGSVRQKIFIEQMAERGLPLPEEFIYTGDYMLKSGISAFNYFYSLSDMPTAIIAANDEMAKGFIVRAHSLGVKIPDDISICGIDTIYDDLFLPKITSVVQNTKMIAETAFNFIKDGNGSANKKKIIPVVFSPGDTTYKLPQM
ncbi:MAG TPA: LacI family DNA-binding transcriptional regulator [Candidatus Alectryocaccobium stercorigallinarum]|nr:LacI family DNA-binding transcriptional regulator [Candidatus Alectryocaccobium stercorigallinarum]